MLHDQPLVIVETEQRAAAAAPSRHCRPAPSTPARPPAGDLPAGTATEQDRPRGRINPATGAALRAFEGRQVSLALADGSRLDAVTLVSAGRGRTPTLWLYSAGTDVFVARRDVVDAWEPQPPRRTRSSSG
jgi:hypothetical protein